MFEYLIDLVIDHLVQTFTLYLSLIVTFVAKNKVRVMLRNVHGIT